MTFDQFFRIIRARWVLAVAVLAFFIVLAALITFVLPKSYEATASVMADFKPDPVAGMTPMTGVQSVTYLATQVDIIKSPMVAARVVRELGIDRSGGTRQQWQDETKGKGDFVAWTATLIGKGLTVKPSRESNVIDVTYQSVDPKFAAGMANAFTKAYMDISLQMRIDPARQYYDFFETRAKLAREKLESAQQRLAQAQREKGIVITDERMDAENARLNEISTQLTTLRALTADASSRSQQARKGAEQTQDVLSSTLIAALKADLSRAEARLDELQAKMGDNHPLVIETKATVSSLRRRIQAETSKVTSSLGINNTITSARQAEAQQAYEAQRTKLLKMKQERNELQVLEREVESANRIYEAIQARQSQMGLESNNSQNGITILSPATEPSTHTFPKFFLNMFLAISIGSLFSIIFALLAEMFDRRIRGPQDLIQGTGLPIIGVMPNPAPLGWSGRMMKSLNWDRRFIHKGIPMSPSGSSSGSLGPVRSTS
jgi:protein tyrosine kinase modulator